MESLRVPRLWTAMNMLPADSATTTANAVASFTLSVSLTMQTFLLMLPGARFWRPVFRKCVPDRG